MILDLIVTLNLLRKLGKRLYSTFSETLKMAGNTETGL